MYTSTLFGLSHVEGGEHLDAYEMYRLHDDASDPRWEGCAFNEDDLDLDNWDRDSDESHELGTDDVEADETDDDDS